jgi:hypothetical protein
LRCDDAERDARVNQEVCKQLGIASVVVMPVVNDDQVLGVFELFSGRAHAFGDRDLSAIQRLSEMVETAVRLAKASESLPKKLAQAGAASKITGPGVREGQFVSDLVVDAGKPGDAVSAKAAPAPEMNVPAAQENGMRTAAEKPVSAISEPITSPKKPLFWSATTTAEPDAQRPAEESDQSHVPPVLRQLRKCEACGFPVSAGRTLCVECEEKKWRGQLRPQASRSVASSLVAVPSSSKIAAQAAPGTTKSTAGSLDVTIAGPDRDRAAQAQMAPAHSPTEVTAESKSAVAVLTASENTSARDFVLSAGVTPSQSWLSANKYILLVLVVIAAAAAALFYFR